ncbi:TetR/AcrR family transcriptional regulator [Kutzneria kofuensis]|uniref:AcrR family transcriptional regulator n=1 Tax=Kutzneria kofuensis TaxID=103725 RepID=A0A7W9NK72_9PSEU|nr:TetR/AcrR family transcriptional regulator [Kutzneria kofuensis]MBB5895086.1 AcrR family transcriptional regulator [Kutzneria kofuensis]
MGHREDLLAGAKRCLVEKGYARTTARDIVAASGANLASIGYHYGSKEALLNQALIQSVREWGEQLAKTLIEAEVDHLGPRERYEAIWARIVEMFGANKQLWTAQFEVLAQIEHAEDVRQVLTAGNAEGWPGLGMLFNNIDPEVDGRQASLVGAFNQALLTGIMAQWLIDPTTALNGDDITEALGIIARSFSGNSETVPVGSASN